MTKAQEQPRDADGKFGSHEGAAPEVTLEQPNEKNGFLLPGKDCECDVDYRCSNHDTEAEERYWRGQYVSGGHIPTVDEDMAYERDSPKRSDLSDYFDKMGL